MEVEVLIPTFNRRCYAECQIRNLGILRELLQDQSVNLRIVVSDNHSIDPVQIPDLASSYTKLVKPRQHLPTAEENLFFGIRQCEAEYIWVLGDDDAIVIENIFDLLISLKEMPQDFVIANSSGSLVNGDFIASRTICSAGNNIRSLPDFAQRTGFWFVLAAFSCIVFRRSVAVANIDRFDTYFKASQIYSHVFWFLETFWSKEFRYYDRPIVVYKQNTSDVSGNHWAKVALRDGVFQGYYWTLGFVRHAKILMHSCDVSADYFGRVLDQNLSHRFHHLTTSVSSFLNVLEDEVISKKNLCRTINCDEKREFLSFVAESDTRLLEPVSILMQNNYSPSLADIREARLMIDKYAGANFYRHYFVRTFAGWNIYYYDGIFRAVPENREAACSAQLNDVSPVASQWHIIADSMADIVKMICEKPYSAGPLWNDSAIALRHDERMIRVTEKVLRIAARLKRLFPKFILRRI